MSQNRTIRILFTDLTYLRHNYGAQGIAFPLMDKLNKRLDAKYAFTIASEHYKDNISFARENGFDIVARPRLKVVLRNWSLPFRILCFVGCLLKGRRVDDGSGDRQYTEFIKAIEDSDAIVDLSGIEFIGNVGSVSKYLKYLDIISTQRLAKKYSKPYFKYTKSYGPFLGVVYRYLVRRALNDLPFIFVRGEDNLKGVRKLGLKIPTYSFPEVAIITEPAAEEWGVKYVSSLGIDPSERIVGLSPSSVIRGINTENVGSSCGREHFHLCRRLIEFLQSEKRQVLLIPHSLDEKHPESCDLALVKELYEKLENKENVFVADDMLTYKQVRSIIGLLDFYVTGRYHSVASALAVAVPVVSLSWHIKYKDMMSLFLDDFLAIDCRKVGVEEALVLIQKYYNNREWFDRDVVLRRKEDVVKQIDRSVEILAKEIGNAVSGAR